MLEPERARVQGEAMKVVLCTVLPVDDAGTIGDVADERVIQVPQVPTNLMEATGLGKREHEGAAVDR
jgi:hypothetical protein